MNSSKVAYLYSAKKPDDSQKDQIIEFLDRKYDCEVLLKYVYDASLVNGFRIAIGDDFYDWSLESRMQQLQDRWMNSIKKANEDIIPLLQDSLQTWIPKAMASQVGHVLRVCDGIVFVSGLKKAEYGEILIFTGGIRGMIQDLRKDEIGCILFGDESEIVEGSIVKRTGKQAGIPVGEAFIGRVVDALGNPIDDLPEIEAEDYYPIERAAPGIIYRQPVNTPLETGLLAIDSMFPIGRGQRELIIGDRQTGKTSVAVDTIVNQKDKNVICVYVAIGQKASSVAQLCENLKSKGAMNYTIVVCATASDSAPLQYIAPYAGTSLAEYFMHQGKDVLIVYDDLSKHAIAYRALSLLLERSPGREAYPGDVFYLHSRLLERASRLSEELGGGSLTALPIIETQAGDVSAYIPTNVISITDGQIYLETEMFHAGFRPAINAGLSVSRVGGAAQIKAMKKIAGPIRTELAQYRELAAFAQFGSELDDDTRERLAQGERIKEVLKQPQYQPLAVEKQIVIIYAVTRKYLLDVPVERIAEFEKGLYEFVETKYPEIYKAIRETGEINSETDALIQKAITEFKNQF